MFSTEIVDHGSRRGNAMQALARWWNPVSSCEALDVLHWAMQPASHHRNLMVIKIIVNLPDFFAVLILLLATTIS